MPPTPPQAAPHLARVDVLRACAILAVFCHHYWLAIGHISGGRWAGGLAERLLVVPWELGFLGVKLFFVISGFCIHLSFLNWRQRRAAEAPLWRPFLASFYWRRFWRIYPPYLGALLLFYFLQYDEPFGLRELWHLCIHGLLLNSLSAAFFYNINPVFWSIAVEWQLYLVYPVLLWIAVKWRIEIAFALASVVALALVFVAPHFTTSYAVLHSPFAYWLEWAIGALIAEFHFAGRRVFRAHAWLVLVTGAGAVWSHAGYGSTLWSHALPTLCFAAVLEGYLGMRGGLRIFERALIPIGLCSYSLYLFHGPYLTAVVGRSAGWLASAPTFAVWIVVPLLYFAPIFALCRGYYRWVELPSIAIGKRLRRDVAAASRR